MTDVTDLNDWEKLGLCHASGGWESTRYFRAPLSIRRLEELGLVETKIDTFIHGGHEIRSEMVRITPAGLSMRQAAIESGFDMFATIKRRA